MLNISEKRLVIACGGTGGHLFPGIAVAELWTRQGGEVLLLISEKQIDALAIGVDVIVATPLRLIDLLKENELQLDGIEIVVLDEADRMADDGFTPQVEWILRKVTGEHQTMLFSATLDGDVAHLVARYMKDPVEVAVDGATDTVGTMHHLFLAVHHMDKDRVVASIAGGMLTTSVFCQTKRTCDLSPIPI